MKDLGDFQTPPGLVAAVLARLGLIGTRWRRVLEPTCGRGHFLAGLLALDPPPAEIHGIEIQADHLAAARAVAARGPRGVRVVLQQGNLFAIDLTRALDWNAGGPLLVVGNPPWVTSAALGALGSANHPDKRNLHGSRGLDALTGDSNFDLAEAVCFKLLGELRHETEPVTLALLCKVAVARRVIERGLPEGSIASASVVRIDARAWFGASVDACLFCLTLDPAGSSESPRIPVYADLAAVTPTTEMGLVRGRLVHDLAGYEATAHADGAAPCVWRQGVKHDAAAVMELVVDDAGALLTRDGIPLDLEAERVAPLLKGTDLARGRDLSRPRRAVIVTQRRMSDDTRGLAASAPRLWAYLRQNEAAFAARKSSVYRSRPPYAMFGIGPYTFAPFKTAVSALHRVPRFRALGPVDGRPVLVDDTCYFVACDSPEQAVLVATLANSADAARFLRAVGGTGAKRVVTKALLQRLDLRALLDRADPRSIREQADDDVRRLAGRSPIWPDRLEALLTFNPGD